MKDKYSRGYQDGYCDGKIDGECTARLKMTSPEKVYQIASSLHKIGRIDDKLWHAILDMKEELNIRIDTD